MLPNVGLGELGMVLLVVLVVMGPKRLPEVARALGKAYRTFQVETRKAQAILKEGLDEVDAAAKLANEPLAELRERDAVVPSPEAALPPAASPQTTLPPAAAPDGAPTNVVPQISPGVIDVADEVREHEDT